MWRAIRAYRRRPAVTRSETRGAATCKTDTRLLDDADVLLSANPEGLSAASDDNTHCWALYNCSSACYDTETPQNNCKCSSSLFVFFFFCASLKEAAVTDIGLRTITGGDQLYVEYQTGNLDQAAIEFDKVDYVSAAGGALARDWCRADGRPLLRTDRAVRVRVRPVSHAIIAGTWVAFFQERQQ